VFAANWILNLENGFLKLETCCRLESATFRGKRFFNVGNGPDWVSNAGNKFYPKMAETFWQPPF
jgi:hypothetical protein